MTVKELSGRVRGKISGGDFYFYAEGAELDGVYGTAALMQKYLEGRFDLAAACIAAGGHKVAWIEQIRVQPELQGRGIGGRLLQHTLRRLSEHGVREVWLSAAPDEDGLRGPLIRFYRQHGFELSPKECRDVADWSSSGTLDIMTSKIRRAE
jgi:ribosomal protein S18 acetylase RimI-like enzyme